MSLAPVLVAGQWHPARDPLGDFRAIDPSTSIELPGRFPLSGPEDVELACAAAADAAPALRGVPAERIARFLEAYASAIERDADALVELAARETGLPASPRLAKVELPRTTDQLRQGAAAARERSWCRATIDTKLGIRSSYGPIGPVALFGPNNFPFAFNAISGGDFVAAIAAGNPVIAKANPGHPGTTQKLAELALGAVNDSGLPPATVQLLYGMPVELGFRLVSHPALGASAFTGTKRAGLALKASADAAGKPIYLEMSSSNPVFVLPGALAERSAAIAEELADSCVLGAGQFCTRPGLSVVERGERAEAFLAELAARLAEGTPGTLLGPSGARAIRSVVAELVRHGAEIVTGGRALEGARCAFANTLLRVSGSAFLAAPRALQTEAFGSVHLLVAAADVTEMVAIAGTLSGSLTGCVYSARDGADDESYRRVTSVLEQRVGRLLNDKMPTGVAVSPAMNHGGPFPATGHPGFTAVGIPASLLRFAVLRCFDNVRPERLPSELRNDNPTGATWRLIDGAWSRGDVPA